MTVTDQLPGLTPRRGKAESHEHVVEPALEQPQQVLSGDAGLAAGLVVVVAELLFEQLVVTARLLLLPKLMPVLRLTHSATAVLARRVRTSLHRALVGEAALTLQKELQALPAALLALGSGVPGHRALLDPPPLARAAAVVCLRRNVLHARHLEPGRLQRADRGLAPRAGALHVDLDLLKPVLHALLRGGLGRHLGGERGRLARALEPGASGRLPRDHRAFAVGERDDRVVERSLDVGLAERDVLAHPPPGSGAPARTASGLRRHLVTFLPRHLLAHLALLGDLAAARALAAARVGLRALPTRGQATPVPEAPVGADLGEAL